MAIVLEGFDGGGKSTLAQRLALPIIHPGAPPKTPELESKFFHEQFVNANRPVIYDRVTCISQQVYRDRLFDEWYWAPMLKMLKQSHCVVVYCRPPNVVLIDDNEWKAAEHDTPEMIEHARNNAIKFVESYDRLMDKIPHVRYDFTTGDNYDMIVHLLRMQFDEKEWKRWLKHTKRMPLAA